MVRIPVWLLDLMIEVLEVTDSSFIIIFLYFFLPFLIVLVIRMNASPV